MPASYPILQLLDHVRGAPDHPFLNDPAAAELEREAERLVGAYCSDTIWLTGNVATAPLATMCDALERFRRRPSAVTILVTAPEPATSRRTPAV